MSDDRVDARLRWQIPRDPNEGERIIRERLAGRGRRYTAECQPLIDILAKYRASRVGPQVWIDEAHLISPEMVASLDQHAGDALAYGLGAMRVEHRRAGKTLLRHLRVPPRSFGIDLASPEPEADVRVDYRDCDCGPGPCMHDPLSQRLPRRCWICGCDKCGCTRRRAC